MELVPIIQRVLTIMAILTAVTLFISYITFKIRQKHRPEQVYIKDKSAHLEPSFVGKSIRRITRITKEILPLVPPSKPKQEHRQISKQQSSTPGKRKAESKQEYSKPRRIEIVNIPSENSAKAPKKSSTPKKNESSVNSLGDDILNKYSDNETQNLYTLKTDNKNKKD